MKKFILSLAFATTMLAATAQPPQAANAQDLLYPQELLSKKGTPILPEAKDWSIGFDANFLLGYVGNLLHGTTATNAPLAAYEYSHSIVFKMMKDANTAYIGVVRLGNVSTKTTTPIVDEVSPGTPTTPAQYVSDTKTTTQTTINLAAGIQKYRGHGRLRGFYGAGVGLTFANNLNGIGGHDAYTYGNAVNTTYQNAVTAASTNFGTGVDGNPNINVPNATRATDVTTGTVFGIGVRGWIGAEYFFAPKMSVSAQYGWGIGILSSGGGSTTLESYNNTTSAEQSITTNGSKTSVFYIDVDNMSGQIILSLYF